MEELVEEKVLRHRGDSREHRDETVVDVLHERIASHRCQAVCGPMAFRILGVDRIERVVGEISRKVIGQIQRGIEPYAAMLIQQFDAQRVAERVDCQGARLTALHQDGVDVCILRVILSRHDDDLTAACMASDAVDARADDRRRAVVQPLPPCHPDRSVIVRGQTGDGVGVKGNVTHDLGPQRVVEHAVIPVTAALGAVVHHPKRGWLDSQQLGAIDRCGIDLRQPCRQFLESRHLVLPLRFTRHGSSTAAWQPPWS